MWVTRPFVPESITGPGGVESSEWPNLRHKVAPGKVRVGGAVEAGGAWGFPGEAALWPEKKRQGEYAGHFKTASILKHSII